MAPFIARTIASGFADFHCRVKIPRENRNISAFTGHISEMAIVRAFKDFVLCRKGSQHALRFVDVTASAENTLEQRAHALGGVRVNFERVRGTALGYFPHSQ